SIRLEPAFLAASQGAPEIRRDDLEERQQRSPEVMMGFGMLFGTKIPNESVAFPSRSYCDCAGKPIQLANRSGKDRFRWRGMGAIHSPLQTTTPAASTPICAVSSSLYQKCVSTAPDARNSPQS